jgi:hypothetical protein
MGKLRYARFTRCNGFRALILWVTVLRAFCIREKAEARMPEKHDASHKNSHFQERSAELQIPRLRSEFMTFYLPL